MSRSSSRNSSGAFNTSRDVENIEMTLNDNNDETGICSSCLPKTYLDSTSPISNERDNTEDMCYVNLIYSNQQFQSESVLERNPGNISSKIQPQRHIPDTKRLQFLENAGPIKCWFLQGSLFTNVILVFACLFVFLQITNNPRNDIQHKETLLSTLCVMDNHNHPLCTNHFMYLQYLLHIVSMISYLLFLFLIFLLCKITISYVAYC